MRINYRKLAFETYPPICAYCGFGVPEVLEVVRRVLVEAAWTYRHPARKTTVLQKRAERASEAVQEIAWKAQTRLCGRYRLLDGRGKLKVQTCTAIARELAGFIWAIGQALPQPIAKV